MIMPPHYIRNEAFPLRIRKGWTLQHNPGSPRERSSPKPAEELQGLWGAQARLREGRRTSSSLSSSSTCWPYLSYSSHVEVEFLLNDQHREDSDQTCYEGRTAGARLHPGLGITNLHCKEDRRAIFLQDARLSQGPKAKHVYCVSHETLVFPVGSNDRCTD